MQTALRTLTRTSRLHRAPLVTCVPRRFAHQSYGDDQSGHPQSDANPRRDLEHPGPEAPANKGKSSSSGSSASTSGQTSSNLSHTQAKSDQGRPAIHQPKSAAEDEDPEVRKHNEEMANRHEKSANQLAEEDNKVDKSFWKGDVGDPNKKGPER